MTDTEDRIMSQCHKWLWNTYPETRHLCWHIANERKQNKIQGAIMKAKGVVSGVPDYVINWKMKTYYIEFKTEIGEQSENQTIVQNQLEKQKINYYIVRSFDEFKQLFHETIF